MDAELERYPLAVASSMAAGFGPQLTGVYLHVSAVLGGFDARRSDIGILVVCATPMSAPA